jgi:hypothetical protein
MRAFQLVDRFQVHGRIFADRGVRTAAGFYALHAIGRQCALANQELGVLSRVDVVGDNGQADRRPLCFAQNIDQGRLSAADRSSHADTKRTLFCVVHKLKQEISLRHWQDAGGLASEQLTIRANFVRFRVHLNPRRRRIVDHILLPDVPAILHRHELLTQSQPLHVR